MASFHPLTSPKSKLYLLPIFLLFITLSSCNEEDNKKNNQTFTVTFSVGEGSAVASQRVTSGSKATAPSPAPTRSGHSFEGWYTSAGGRFDFNTAITANITLSAKWKAITSTVTITYPDITGAVNTPLTAVTPTKAPAAATGTFNVKSGTTALPAGLTLNSSTGAISGTPTASATTTVTIEFVGTGNYTGTIESLAIINVNSLPINSIMYSTVRGAVNTSITAVTPTRDPAEATGTFRVKPSSSALPTGLTLNGNTGTISGTPTAQGTRTTMVTIELIGTFGYAGSNAETTVTIALTDNRPTVNSITYPNIAGFLNTSLTAVTPTKDPPAATGFFRVKSDSPALPDGLSLDSGTGAISGTPTASAITNVTIEFVGTGNYIATAETTVTITVTGRIINSITYSDIEGFVKTSITAVTPTKDPAAATGFFRLKSSSLPLLAGLSLNTGTGAISGTPTASGGRPVTVEFVGSGNYAGTTVEGRLRIFVNRIPVNSIMYSNITGTANTFITGVTPTKDPAAATGMFRVKLGTLPAGLSISGGTGIISGRPRASETTTVTIELVSFGDYTGNVETTVTITIN